VKAFEEEEEGYNTLLRHLHVPDSRKVRLVDLTVEEALALLEQIT